MIADYLPEQLDAEEIADLVTSAIAQTGAADEGMRAMGKVMGVLTPQVRGRADGGAVAAEVRRQLEPERGPRRSSRRAAGDLLARTGPAVPVARCRSVAVPVAVAVRLPFPWWVGGTYGVPLER